MEEQLFLFTDGASRGNPGPSAMGIVLKNQKGETLLKKSQFCGRGTNNEAEYKALILGLEAARRFKPKQLVCLLDSELVVSQVKGVFRVKKPHLKKLLSKIRRLERYYPKVTYRLIPRERNKVADELANRVLNRFGR